MRAVGYRPSHLVADTSRMWTKAIWDHIPWTSIEDGEREGWVFFDDFHNTPALSETNADLHKYAVYQDTAGTNTIAQTTSEYGELAITMGTTDNEEGWISTGGNTGSLAKFIEQASGTPHTIAFEARWKKNLTTAGGTFVGLGDPGLAAADTIVDGGTLADANFFGFQVPEADPDGCDWTYKADGQTQVVTVADIHTIVADTYVKTGFLHHYKNPASQQIKGFVNGVRNGTYITKTNIEAATFPGDDDLAFLAGCKNSTTTATILTLDWVKIALVVNS